MQNHMSHHLTQIHSIGAKIRHFTILSANFTQIITLIKIEFFFAKYAMCQGTCLFNFIILVTL